MMYSIHIHNIYTFKRQHEKYLNFCIYKGKEDRYDKSLLQEDDLSSSKLRILLTYIIIGKSKRFIHGKKVMKFVMLQINI